jgi:adenylate kinase family enzyme
MITLDQLSRVAIVGTSCSGKTTLAGTLAAELGAPRIELDALHWGPNWTPRPREALRESVDCATSQPHWICDGNYSVVRDLVWQRATALVWLNYSFPFVLRRALHRTLSRCFYRTRLYADNQETFRKAFLSSDSILLWVCQTHWQHRHRLPVAFREPQHAHLKIVQLQSQAATTQFLATVCELAAEKAR